MQTRPPPLSVTTRILVRAPLDMDMEPMQTVKAAGIEVLKLMAEKDFYPLSSAKQRTACAGGDHDSVGGGQGAAEGGGDTTTAQIGGAGSEQQQSDSRGEEAAEEEFHRWRGKRSLHRGTRRRRRRSRGRRP
eukprot:3029497-Pleurochrysis_carterae.AAC.1